MDLALGDTVTTYVNQDDAPVPCGWRRFLVAEVADDCVALLYQPTLTAVEMTWQEIAADRTFRKVEADRHVQARLLIRSRDERAALGLEAAFDEANDLIANHLLMTPF